MESDTENGRERDQIRHTDSVSHLPDINVTISALQAQVPQLQAAIAELERARLVNPEVLTRVISV